jgi:hypothetical protein
MCEACKSLVDKLKDVPPHANLEKTGSASWTGGYAKGAIESYACRDCGTTWTRDTDKKDRGAGWEVKKEG